MPPTAPDMLSSLLRSGRGSHRGSNRGSPVRFSDARLFASQPNTPSPGYQEPRHATADFTEADEDEEDEEDEDGELEDFDEDDDHPRRGTRFQLGNDEHGQSAGSLLPLFSASYLDSLPVYNLVHSIRVLVQSRTETILSWDQLRSPQVSQFLIKPMQQQIRTHHFNRATLYALMANSLQFAKEGQLYPGNAGTSTTRAKACELLALKLLKEYTTRELIDALSYDFFPLQGMTQMKPYSNLVKSKPTAARISTLEIAIRASAKQFLAHPLVVQQLEAIWNGAITFYSSQDYLHRIPQAPKDDQVSIDQGLADAETPLLTRQTSKSRQAQLPLHKEELHRRSVALYDPRNASPLKLSRLRVPRYRQILSTLSLFVLICLFLAVLVERSSRISPLELIFWFWSAGFMLDEVVGFNEQGFSLYIMSFWNIFDLGILLMLILYYCMRIYGVFLVEAGSWNEVAYDVLAANAILLLPRIFSVLDHYPYFSQLLLAFRLMAVDLVAVLVLVLISASGFFVFFTLSRNSNDAPEVIYKIFQILMGFTPAAWDVWDEYTLLGRGLLVIFMIISHFIVLTILITVLTNSFTSIAKNAREEHQFVFAINTLSMVKNDALFSYIPPGNIIAWMLTPLRYVMSIQRFVLLNRQTIKITHFPLLFCIYFYEKLFLASAIYEPTDLIERQGQGNRRSTITFANPARNVPFSPTLRVQDDSVTVLQKDRALEEVFRRPPGNGTMRSQRRHEQKRTRTAIRNWMDQNDHDDEMGPPMSHWPTIDTRTSLSGRRRMRNISDIRSAASDPAELMSNSGFPTVHEMAERIQEQQENLKDQTDADGDDELVTNEDDDDDDEIGARSRKDSVPIVKSKGDYFSASVPLRPAVVEPSSVSSSAKMPMSKVSPRQPTRRSGLHSRTMSTNTILYAPKESRRQTPKASSSSENEEDDDMLQEEQREEDSEPRKKPSRDEPPAPRQRPKSSRVNSAVDSSALTGTRTPRKPPNTPGAARPKPIPAPKAIPDRLYGGAPRLNRHVSSVDVDINSDMGLDPNLANVSSSFATQMAMATGQLKGLGQGGSDRDADRMSRLVLARMKTLEESIADIAKEVRGIRSAVPTAQNSGDDGSWKDAATTSSDKVQQRPRLSRGKSWGMSGNGGGGGGAKPKKKPGENSQPSSVMERPAMAVVARQQQQQLPRSSRAKGKTTPTPLSEMGDGGGRDGGDDKRGGHKDDGGGGGGGDRDDGESRDGDRDGDSRDSPE